MDWVCPVHGCISWYISPLRCNRINCKIMKVWHIQACELRHEIDKVGGLNKANRAIRTASNIDSVYIQFDKICKANPTINNNLSKRALRKLNKKY